MASEFLLVAGTEWTELADAPAKFVSHGVDMQTLINNVEGQEWVYVSGYMEEMGLVQPNQLIQNARVINPSGGESNYRFWYIL